MDRWIKGWMDRWMDGWMSECIYGRIDVEGMDGWMIA